MSVLCHSVPSVSQGSASRLPDKAVYIINCGGSGLVSIHRSIHWLRVHYILVITFQVDLSHLLLLTLAVKYKIDALYRAPIYGLLCLKGRLT